MPPVKLENNPRKWLPGRKEHIKQRMKDRKLQARDADLIKAFFNSDGEPPLVPDLAEAPAGWHKYLTHQLLICGESNQWKGNYILRN